jgi:predicted small secreted protein
MHTSSRPAQAASPVSRSGRSVCLIVLLVVVAMASAACGSNDATGSGSDQPGPVSEVPAEGSGSDQPGPVSEAPGEGDQRELTARIKEIYTASASIEFDELDILSGEEARQEAIAAGAIEPGEDLPNDVWIRDDHDVTERLTVDPTAVVWIYDCTRGCERVQVDLGAFLRHEIQPYGGDFAVWEITITGEMITSLLEVYLP